MKAYTGLVDAVVLNKDDFDTLYPLFERNIKATVGFVLQEIKMFCSTFRDGKSFILSFTAEHEVKEKGVIPTYITKIDFAEKIIVPRTSLRDKRTGPNDTLFCDGVVFRWEDDIFENGFGLYMMNENQPLISWRWSYVEAARKRGFIASQMTYLLAKPIAQGESMK